jgi:hypothetical protein
LTNGHHAKIRADSAVKVDDLDKWPSLDAALQNGHDHTYQNGAHYNGNFKECSVNKKMPKYRDEQVSSATFPFKLPNFTRKRSQLLQSSPLVCVSNHQERNNNAIVKNVEEFGRTVD